MAHVTADFGSLPATEATRAIREGCINPAEYRSVLVNTALRQRHLNAFNWLNPAMYQPDPLALARDTGPGLLRGLAVAVKDNIDVLGAPTTAGTLALRNNYPDSNSAVVQSLVDAGAVIMGKTNMHELALGVTSINASYGTVMNPCVPDHIVGGSSGGNGAAIAAKLVPVGIGTDTGGSIRLPAALTGTVGFRPSVGRYSRSGTVPISRAFDTVGVMARTVADVALIDSVVSGSARAKPCQPEPTSRIRLGVPRAYFYDDLAVDVAQPIEWALQHLRAAGIELVEIELSDVEPGYAEMFATIGIYELLEVLPKYLAGCRNLSGFATFIQSVVSDDVRTSLELMLGTAAVTTREYHRAVKAMGRLRTELASVFAEQGIRGILYPSSPIPAVSLTIAERTFAQQMEIQQAYLRNTVFAALGAMPALTQPIERSHRHGAPVGLEVSGLPGSDRQLLSIAASIEEALAQC